MKTVDLATALAIVNTALLCFVLLCLRATQVCINRIEETLDDIKRQNNH